MLVHVAEHTRLSLSVFFVLSFFASLQRRVCGGCCCGGATVLDGVLLSADGVSFEALIFCLLVPHDTA